jgi:diguanylate cyclase (GGDEF)-like protein
MPRKQVLSQLELSLNVSRHIAALTAALAFTLIYTFLFYKEYTRLSTDDYILAISIFWIGNFVFTVIIITGISRLFHNIGLSSLQLVWATSFVLIGAYFLNELRGIALMFIFAALSFGFFRFKIRHFIFAGAFAVLGYLIVILLLLINQPLRINYSEEILQFAAFTVSISVMVYIGISISRLRIEYKEINTHLKEAVELNTKLATTDDLTGLYTRRYFMEVLEQQKALSERDGSDFVVCFADLDHFKHVNDGFGHHTGDVVLQKFSEIIQNSIREIDYAARFGGEEFVLLLVNTDIEQSLNVAERIREALETYNFSDIAPALNITVSIGLANFKKFNSLQETLMSADNHMYKAKESGRNRVIHE